MELYAAASDRVKLPQPEQLGNFIADFHHTDFVHVSDQITQLQNELAIRHLFMVASSLDSMIVGEAQILSQVKEAYELACSGDTAASLMHRAFQRATVVARRVANETEIHRRRISVPSVAVSEIASDFFERFDDKQILLIGAGEMGTETLRYLIDAGAKSIQILNRNAERSAELAQQFNAISRPWSELDASMAQSDLIISTTSASQPIVSLEQFRACRAKRSARAVLILDLAVPRDFDSAIAELSDVYLFTVDDLQQVCDKNLQARQQEWPRAERIVDQELQKFLTESVHRNSGVTIRKLREQAELVKGQELERLVSKLKARGLDSQAEKELSIAFDRLVNKLLHPPLQTLREHADSNHHASMLDALRRLFRISD